MTARRIVDYRKEHGPFARREQLMEVEGVGPATFTQAAGFLKLARGREPARPHLDPSRELSGRASSCSRSSGSRPTWCGTRSACPSCAPSSPRPTSRPWRPSWSVGEFTLRDIIEALGRPERDPRDDLPKPIFKKGVLKLEDLTAGMELKGTVLNVVDFGAFVDIGLKDSGLVHISQLANRYVKSPHDVVSVGDVVTVWVMGVDQERKRVSLTMVKPGTERHRGPQGGGAAAAGGEPRDPNRERENRGQGQGRRGARRRTRAAPARLGADVAAGRCPLGRHAGRGPGPPSRSRHGRDRGRGPRPRRPGRRPGGLGCRGGAAGTAWPRTRAGPASGPARILSAGPAAVGPVVRQRSRSRPGPATGRPGRHPARAPRLRHSPRMPWPATSRSGPSASSSSSGKRGSKDPETEGRTRRAAPAARRESREPGRRSRPRMRPKPPLPPPRRSESQAQASSE